MTPEPNSVDDHENTVGQGPNDEVNGMAAEIDAGQASVEAGDADESNAQVRGAGSAAAAESEVPAGADVTGGPEPEAPGAVAGEATPAGEAPLAEMAVRMREIADASDRYHARAEQREGVIDHLRSELDLLRRGERRGVLRPVLAELCRLRNDLLKQAGTLPADFGADKAADLLRSYAETIELTLESNGVVTYAPDSGDPFNPRMHRRISGEPTGDQARAGHVAAVKRDGYLDIEANSPITPADVTVFTVTKGEEEK
jgi:molecular chaperone GrpE